MTENRIVNKRNLPYVEPIGATFFLTCPLKGAITQSQLLEIEDNYLTKKHSLNSQGQKQNEADNFFSRKEYVLDLDDVLLQNNGPSFLEAPEIARILLARIESYHMRYYRLLALSILPNHFHMLIDTSIQIKGILEPDTVPIGYRHLPEIMKLIKGGTARYINQWRNTQGEQVWEKESFEIYIKNEKMLQSAVQYILHNPVKAGITNSHEEHLFTFANEF
jgi:REP element-mobilizing transposase RayT